jgi:hypothetical protein
VAEQFGLLMVGSYFEVCFCCKWWFHKLLFTFCRLAYEINQDKTQRELFKVESADLRHCLLTHEFACVLADQLGLDWMNRGILGVTISVDIHQKRWLVCVRKGFANLHMSNLVVTLGLDDVVSSSNHLSGILQSLESGQLGLQLLFYLALYMIQDRLLVACSLSCITKSTAGSHCC